MESAGMKLYCEKPEEVNGNQKQGRLVWVLVSAKSESINSGDLYTLSQFAKPVSQG